MSTRQPVSSLPGRRRTDEIFLLPPTSTGDRHIAGLFRHHGQRQYSESSGQRGKYRLYQLACQWYLLLVIVYPICCTVKTSVKVTHFIPEAVVSAYLNPGDNPWTEMSTVSNAASGAEGSLLESVTGVSTGGGRQEMKAPGERKQNLHFYYGDAYGHPATKVIGGMVPGYSCDSAATPFMPYFNSSLDALVWRTGVPETLYPEALIPGQRENRGNHIRQYVGERLST
ncbi:integrating conjugative element protein, PFL_4710 family [Citrobacter koseri]|uniref:Integrating conjugative element protein, PFL_4710 family n=1 Tax=Citrobacter koseri TaxID=545 RepID=A0A3S4J592_CITKO|nr:integrating conjugative element protein, PFL_4710 family [Citrobacter koseri]